MGKSAASFQLGPNGERLTARFDPINAHYQATKPQLSQKPAPHAVTQENPKACEVNSLSKGNLPLPLLPAPLWRVSKVTFL